WHLRNGINRLSTVSGAEEVRTCVIQDAVLLDVLGPVGSPNRVTGGAIGFNCVLVDSSVDHSQIVKDLGSLRAFARAQESRNGYRGRNAMVGTPNMISTRGKPGWFLLNFVNIFFFFCGFFFFFFFVFVSRVSALFF